tara:strand:- start:18125 stop:18307 length:183 start_codon:yes stop_codon:yes gene_type:complete
MKQHITLGLKVVAAALIGLEVAIPPDPYKMQLVVALVLLICIKYDVADNILELIDKKWRL